MITRTIFALFIFCAMSNYLMAAASPSPELQAGREQVLHRYISALGRADLQDITSLFTEDGTVISTAKGKIAATIFFNGFLPEIETAKTVVHQTYTSREDSNRYAARFHFIFQFKDGEQGDGEYIDEFVFAPNSTQLVQVAMLVRNL